MAKEKFDAAQFTLQSLCLLRKYFKKMYEKYGVDEMSLLNEGMIYYMNGNDGTDFDWDVNGCLCEFYSFYPSEAGCVKIYFYKSGEVNGYFFKEGELSGEKTDLGEIPQSEAQMLYEGMMFVADGLELWDKGIDELLLPDPSAAPLVLAATKDMLTFLIRASKDVSVSEQEEYEDNLLGLQYFIELLEKEIAENEEPENEEEDSENEEEK